MKTILYYSQEEKQYFIEDEKKECEDCQNIIKEFGFLVVKQYKNKYFNSRYVCLDCMKEIKNNEFYDRKSVYQFHIEKNIPKDAKPILSFKIDLKGCIEIDTGDIHKIVSENPEEDIDRTRLAGRESWDGACIGKNIDPLLEQKDAEVSTEDEFDKLMNQQLNAIPFDDKGKIGFDEEIKEISK